MSYRVFWSPTAEARFEKIVNGAIDRALLAAAAKFIDKALAENPNTFGESRYDNVRVGFESPLGVQFEVQSDVRTVIVFDVWRFDRKRN